MILGIVMVDIIRKSFLRTYLLGIHILYHIPERISCHVSIIGNQKDLIDGRRKHKEISANSFCCLIHEFLIGNYSCSGILIRDCSNVHRFLRIIRNSKHLIYFRSHHFLHDLIHSHDHYWSDLR